MNFDRLRVGENQFQLFCGAQQKRGLIELENAGTAAQALQAMFPGCQVVLWGPLGLPFGLQCTILA